MVEALKTGRPCVSAMRSPARVSRPSLASALALVLALVAAGCLDAPAAEEAPLPDTQTDGADLRPIEASFSGTAMGNPASPFLEEFTFDVPQGAVGINATLSWSDPVARFGLELVDPYGELVEEGYPEQDGVLRVATLEPPASGTWVLRVTSDLSVNVPFALEAVAELLVPQDNVVRTTAQMNAGTFREINVIMEANATFRFTFEASGDVNWDVHSHPESGVKYWDEGTGTSHEGSFTAPERGIYSLLFENAGALPVDITYEMTGAFRLHSHAQ